MIKDIRCPAVSSTSLRILGMNQLGSLYGLFALKGNLELECSQTVRDTHAHTRGYAYKPTRRQTHAFMHTCPLGSLIHTLDLYSEHRQPCSFCFALHPLPLLLTSVSSRGFNFCVSRRVVDFSVSICLFTCLGFCMSFALFLAA